jgi:hypothetical protein
VFEFNALLVGNRCDAEFQPTRIAVAWRDYGELHGVIFNIRPGNWQMMLDP